MKKTIGMFAHVDAGKTTLAEQLLFHTKAIRQRGRVDHKDTFLDTHEIEKQRGITVFADQAKFTFNQSDYYLIDTPGHVDFSPEMERAIQVMDYAVIIISAVEGIEGHTETVWRLLQKHQVPTFFFINKTDRVGADVLRVKEEIRNNLTLDVCDITETLNEKEMKEELIEFLAERDETLLEKYMETGYQPDIWLETMRTMINGNELYPCAYGSALQDIGVESFLRKMDLLTSTNYDHHLPFAGRVYKIRYDDKGTRITFIKAVSGTLKVREEVSYANADVVLSEKITQIRIYNGNKFITVDQVSAGEIFAVTGLSSARAGDGLGALKEKAVYEMSSALKSRVIFDPSIHVKEVLRYFHILDAENPSLNVTWEERSQEIHIRVMGTIQLEVLKQLVKERFHLDVQFGEPEILYKETVESVVCGYGHFEPLGHYAEVHLKIEPADRNSGISFEIVCHTDDLPVGTQNLIRHHLYERDHHGLLTGSPLTDVKITLLTGRAHNKHTSGGDFREAAYRALRQGLEKAANVLLEPFYAFKMKLELDQLGKILTDIQNAHGTFDVPLTEGNKAILTGKVPVATFMNYGPEFASITQGKGTLNLVFGGYYPCHNPNQVMERINYNKDADPDYSSSSIFCSKGQGYSVPWDQAEAEMHCL
ncbi:TetM/TetW/TetO/TetS family tetracycline resistance ribosomal protection protein [Neobacillus sp. PS2-9]|uniref:TetM/TetW/TetO/TetS family tetracycline resistance ribosomal protection protein n=1 Tax=Neobacillus sp. PS2-9 TaxID=3070676 RepID=UPI0027E0E169|nr:TetM/TetW/TetO/TetS family tetracycline resistance ribosomal protection protein [Neobacillus sp. PS2-9]WML55951.1 TetM/TetW/TetO/TetS family tetracycline resistance ribosomal protection protein [Neobacillus sp. PS2-9]